MSQKTHAFESVLIKSQLSHWGIKIINTSAAVMIILTILLKKISMLRELHENEPYKRFSSFHESSVGIWPST